MSTTATPYRLVPIRFEDFLEKRVRRVEHEQECDHCGEAPGWGFFDAEPNPTCWGCLRYHFGYEQAEEKNARLIIGAAVSAALAANAPEEVRLAFEDAICESVRIESELID